MATRPLCAGLSKLTEHPIFAEASPGNLGSIERDESGMFTNRVGGGGAICLRITSIRLANCEP